MSTRPPNILFIITDQMRSTAMGCAGVEAVITPHLDALAGEGTRFTNAIANSPSCTASRGNLLTGQHTMRTGLINNDMQLGTHHRGLAHGLNARGYDCGWIGKWHLDGVNRGAYIPPGPRRQGFDAYWAGVECNHNYMAGYHYDEATRAPIWHDRYEPEVQTDLAIDFLAARGESERPFFLGLSWGPPHCPYEQVPQRYRDMYDPATLPLMPTATDARLLDRSVGQAPKQVLAVPDAEHERRKREIIRDYYAQVTALDENLGRLLAALAAQGLAEETIVVFTSDHGDMLFNHDRGWKGKPWRESVGIPLVVRWPGRVPAGRVTGGTISMVDMMPTLVTLAGGEPTAGIDGSDRSAFVLGDERAAAAEAYINYPSSPAFFSFPEWRGLVTATHSYACTRDGAWLLFDDVADPLQTRNLAGDPAQAALQAELHARTLAWLGRTGDDFPSSRELADRVHPGHVGHMPPTEPLLPVIRDGQAARLAAWRAATTA